jgi:histidyl-tRNA synthetase
MKKLSTDPYKGVRDFYPEDMRVLNYIKETAASVLSRYGYLEYGASVLEPAELYAAKSGEEIVNEQTYTFEDRGGRQVTMRPEMTPTVARMIAARRRDLKFPVRWFSFPNLFRYEAPQRGRLREHYQLNVDCFGDKTTEAEFEILEAGAAIMRALGAHDGDYVIKVNRVDVTTAVMDACEIPEESRTALTKLVDKMEKLDRSAVEERAEAIAGDRGLTFLESIAHPRSVIAMLGERHPAVLGMIELIERMSASGTTVTWTPSLVRGFDYYTGLVFEFFDAHKENPRSLFGGGRYDGLTTLFGDDPVPAVGFGMGDVTMRDFLVTHNLLPELPTGTDIAFVTLPGADDEKARSLARGLRDTGACVAEARMKGRGDGITYAERNGIPFVVFFGERESEAGMASVIHRTEEGRSYDFPITDPEQAVRFIRG